MQTALLLSALVMGVATGPHCVVMCGPLCAGIQRGCAAARRRRESEGGPAGGARLAAAALPDVHGRPVQWMASSPSIRAVSDASAGLWAWHLGRLIGYSAAGALLAASVGSLAWLADLAPALRPLWAMLHAAVLAWGLVMLVRARPPVFGQVLSRWFGQRVAPGHRPSWWPLALGVSWAALPCGLLYSALMLAGLADSAATGAAAMALFAVGSGLSLWAGPGAWRVLQHRLLRSGDPRAAEAWANRITGLLLVAMACASLFGDLIDRVIAWCR